MERDWKAKLVNVIAPHSWWDTMAKSLLFVTLINITNMVVMTLLSQPRPPLLVEILGVTMISLPYVALFMAVLYRQRQLQETLSALARTDMLTGLPNRRSFLERAQAALEQDATGALLLLDADHFKRINDRWGHAAGDAALAAISARLRTALRKDDLLARLGGEEFAAFLPAVAPEEARILAERLCLPIPVPHPEGELSVTLSVGAALARPDASLSQLMTLADRALYRAKAEGRARMHLAEEDQDRAA